MDDYIETNRANWDDRVAGHVVAYRADELADDPTALSVVAERDHELFRAHLPNGSAAGLDLVHLQCHIGTDTISWARLGARVTGIDFSAKAIAEARRLAERAGIEATFVESPVEGASAAVGERFDVVYTGIGAICWLRDLDAWAREVAALLKPGGVLLIRDMHPMFGTTDWEQEDGTLMIRTPYFASGVPLEWDEPTSYVGDAVIEHSRSVEWPHPISEILGAVLGAGLTIEAFGEQDDVPWKGLPFLVEVAPETWALPTGRDRLPMTFSLVARAPSR